MPAHAEPGAGHGTLFSFGLGKPGERDQAAPSRLAGKADPHRLGEVCDVVGRLRPGGRRHALKPQQKAPGHGLHDPCAGQEYADGEEQ